MFDFLLPLVDFCNCHAFFNKEEKRENVEKETAFLEVCTWHWYGIKKNEGMLGLLEIFTGKVNTCFLLVFILEEEEGNN